MLDVIKTIKLHIHYRHNGTVSNCLVMEHNNQEYVLRSGIRGSIYAFTLDEEVYVLSTNKTIGYIGMSRYMVSEPIPINNVLLCDIQEIKEILGDDWKRRRPITIAQKLFFNLYN